MRDAAAFSFEEHWEITIEPFRDVIRIQDRDLGRFGQAFAAHHPNVHPGDGENAGAAHRRGRGRRHFGSWILDFGLKREQEGMEGDVRRRR